jgi:hypothetical protein
VITEDVWAMGRYVAVKLLCHHFGCLCARTQVSRFVCKLSIRACVVVVGDQRPAWAGLRNYHDGSTACSREVALFGTSFHVLAWHPFYRVLKSCFSGLCEVD